MTRKILLVLTMATMSVGSIACGGGVRDEAGADQPSDGTDSHQCSGNSAQVFGGQCYVKKAPTPAEAGGAYVAYNPCPAYQPYQHCNFWGACFCSAYP